jgi:hypothetical protein
MSVLTGECSTTAALTGREPPPALALRKKRRSPPPVMSPTVNAVAKMAVVIMRVLAGV